MRTAGDCPKLRINSRVDAHLCKYKQGEKTMKISLKAARVNAGLTQTQAAIKAGKNKMTISNWENGKSPIDSFSLKKLCAIYGVTIGDIFLPSKLANR